MTPERWQQIEAIFQQALEVSPVKRPAYLAQACGSDTELRQEVESLLAVEIAETFIEAPIQGIAHSLTTDNGLADQRIGVYRIIRLLGRGGMGEVYEAVRDDQQFTQKVALKIVRHEMNVEFVRQRFLSERQILASLKHPNIAHLLDGGTTPNGLSYFAMEYIEGEPITDYCRFRDLSIAEKLRLFQQVCSAVQHAHQKLVVHRDIKPNNILVTKDGTTKLLDFGIAKLLDRSLQPREALETTPDMRLMTPDYASPEQVRGQAITTATDIYSLGAVLYEMLTETRPHKFTTPTPLEIERAICETEILKPSEVVRQTAAAPTKLARQLGGDVDNIILKAMRKEPERRYRSVEQFSEDIQRYLDGRPIVARPDTIRYRTGKFLRRNRLAVVAVALVILSLAAGLALANYQARRAERRFQQVRKLANTLLFDFHDEIQTLPGSTHAREMLVKTALEYLDSLAQEAGGDTALQLELAQAYLRVGDVQGNPRGGNLGHPEAALVSYRKALTLSQKLAARDRNNLIAQRWLGESYFKVGDLQAESGDRPSGAESLRQGTRIADVLAARTGEEQDLILASTCHTFLGNAELYAGNLTEALSHYQIARPLIKQRLEKFPRDKASSQFAASHNHLGETLASMGDLAGAIENFQQSAPIYEALNRKNPSDPFFRRELLVVYYWLGSLAGNPDFINQGDRETALRYYSQAEALGEEQLRIDPKNAMSRFEIAGIYAVIGDVFVETNPAHSVALYRQGLTANQSVLESAPNEFRFLRRQAGMLRRLAAPLRRLGDRQGAQENLRKSLVIVQALATKHPTNAKMQAEMRATLDALGNLLLEMGDHPGALDCYQKALSLAEVAASTSPADMYAQWWLADSYAALGLYHASLASAPHSAPTERLTNWQAARAWRQKSLAVWDGWTQRGKSSIFNTTRREQAARALADCDAVLAKLSAR